MNLRAWYSINEDWYYSQQKSGEGMWISNPLSICIRTNKYCNLTCGFCLSDSSPTEKSNVGWIEATLYKLSEIVGTTRIVWSGGEPLLVPDLLSLLELSKKLGHINIVATNGTLIKRFDSADWLDISIKGIDDIDYERHTKNRIGYRVWRNLESTVQASCRVSVSIILGIHGIEKLDLIFGKLINIGVSRIKFYRPLQLGRLKDLPDHDLVERELAFAKEYFKGSSVLASFPLSREPSDAVSAYWVVEEPGYLTAQVLKAPIIDKNEMKWAFDTFQKQHFRIFVDRPYVG